MFNKIENIFYITILFISFFTILLALYIEHILSVPACKLCLYQRIPYILSTIICFFGYFFSNNKIWLYLLIVTFLSSVALSGYHLGIEINIFTEFSGCTNKNLNTIDKTELLQSLNNFLPNCKDVNFKLFGLSLATINLFISLLVVIISMFIIKNEKNR